MAIVYKIKNKNKIIGISNESITLPNKPEAEIVKALDITEDIIAWDYKNTSIPFVDLLGYQKEHTPLFHYFKKMNKDEVREYMVDINDEFLKYNTLQLLSDEQVQMLPIKDKAKYFTDFITFSSILKKYNLLRDSCKAIGADYIILTSAGEFRIQNEITNFN